MIQNQEITLINNLHISNSVSDYNKKIPLPLDIKSSKVKNLIKYKKKFGCHVDVSSDFDYSLEESLKHMNNHFDDNEIIDKIATSIRRGEIINIEMYRNTYLSSIIDAFNDYICSKNVGSNNEVNTKYSEMKKELEDAKKHLLESESKIAELTEIKETLETTNTSLIEENRSYEETNQKILELLKKPSK